MPLALASELRDVDEPVLARPDQRAELDSREPGLLGELARQRVLVALSGLDAAARRRPPAAEVVLEADHEHAACRIEDERAHARSEAAAPTSGRPAPGTIAAAPTTAPPRSPARSTAARRGASPRAFAPAGRARAARRTRRGRPPCRRTRSSPASARARSARAAPPSPRSRPRRRSPEPGVVR